MYHDAYKKNKLESGFSEASAGIYKIHLNSFESQVQMIDTFIKKNHLGKDYIRFTFDDGGVSSYSLLAPLLEKYGYKGYFFISTKYIGFRGFLSENQIKDLDNRGHVIGGHSDTHRQRMNTLSYEEILLDWQQCSNRLENILGHKISCCSLPCGYSSPNILKVLKTLGYTDVYTSEATEMIRQIDGINLYGRYGIKETMSNEYVVRIVTSSYVRMKIKAVKFVLNNIKILMGGSYVKVRESIIQNLKIHF